ncbi:hypothetical protein [Halorubrum lipolyticum]|uniref:Uncharacterized protein n=1 Tax=Halorubrum lipolyticum DSM 21995 TaxID=1227482 RepID=M0NQ70_9EURY|nr:hypothetical protein [Halorubrum lipolyticum]EMA59349.1 hypothetical protein C469_11991 [Halorubrum lipolyticum DSM 21995]
MAHKLAHRLQSAGDEPPDIDRDESGPTGVTRRRYARLSGAAVATIATLTGRLNGVVAASTEDAGPERLIRIRGSGAPSTYEVTVDGELVADEGTSRIAGHVSGSTAEGAVAGDERGYRFRGELRDVTVDGDAEVSVDGESFEA